MSKKYFTLLVRDDKREPWQIEFGDYDRDVVEFEREDFRLGAEHAVFTKIISTAPEQASINAAVAKLNEEFDAARHDGDCAGWIEDDPKGYVFDATRCNCGELTQERAERNSQ